MIVIVNQHKGTFKELIDNINNYLSQWDSNKWYQILTVDWVTDKSYEFVSSYFNDFNKVHKDKMYVLCSEYKHYPKAGLSPSRWNCMIEGYKRFPNMNENDLYLFGCTNSRFKMKLTDQLHGWIMGMSTGTVTVVDCKYPSDSKIANSWTHEFDDVTDIKVDEFINCPNRPDCTILVPFWLFYMDYNTYDLEQSPFISMYDEMYMPEDLIWLFGADKNKCIRHIHKIEGSYLQSAWYNNDGMSATFSRATVLDNKTGFHNRAVVLLNRWMKGDLKLTADSLKNLVYDYTTLHNINLKELDGTILKPLVMWALDKWSSNKEYNHLIKFIE
jgi:hypothetical protein